MMKSNILQQQTKQTKKPHMQKKKKKEKHICKNNCLHFSFAIIKDRKF